MGSTQSHPCCTPKHDNKSKHTYCNYGIQQNFSFINPWKQCQQRFSVFWQTSTGIMLQQSIQQFPDTSIHHENHIIPKHKCLVNPHHNSIVLYSVCHQPTSFSYAPPTHIQQHQLMKLRFWIAPLFLSFPEHFLFPTYKKKYFQYHHF